MFRAVFSRISKSAIVLSVAVLPLASGSAKAENLADALVGAYNTSGLLMQNRALLRAADEDVGIALSALRPILDWTGSYTYSNTDAVVSGVSSRPETTKAFFGLTASLLLYDGGNSRIGVQAAQETVLATRQTLVSIEQSILFRAVVAYMNMLRTTENLELRKNNVRVLGEELRAAQDRFEVGEVTRTDVALAESRQAASFSGLAIARGELANAKLEYLNAVGSQPGTLLKNPPLPRRPASLKAAQSVAVRNHPDVLAAQHQVAAADLNVKQAETLLGPTASLSASAGFSNTYNSPNYTDNATVSLGLSQRLYQGGAISAAVRQTMASRDALRANLLTVQENVSQDVGNAFVGVEVAKASLVATEKQIEAAQVAFEGVREEAKLGARTTLDVLDAEQELLDALAERILAQADQYIAAYDLLAAQGLLTAERLSLNVQIYDPTAYYNRVKNAPSRYSKQGADLDRVLRSLGKK